MQSFISRRHLLLGAATGISLAAVSACSILETEPDTGRDDGDGEATPDGKEAPMLAAQVADGSLPPLEERIPAAPRVIEPHDGPGIYGGTLRTVLASMDPSWLWMSVANDHLVVWDETYSEIIPNVAEDVEIQEDGRIYIFHLREGMRWSDGEPFTSADLVWWYENILLNKGLTPVVPTALRTGEDPVEVTADGDWTVTFTFKEPNALFLENLTPHGPAFSLVPRHYLEQFHQEFNPDLPDDWNQDMLLKMDRIENPDLPVLTGWVPRNPHGDGGRQVWVRNPYYWKVDPDGRQLPYVDEVAFTFFNDPEPLLLAASNGEIDFYMRTEITIPKNRPVLTEGQESGGYTLVTAKDPNHNTMGICLNLTSDDPAKRRLYQNRDFRIALSHAIDRQQIIDLVYQRQGQPWQTAPRPEVPFYDATEEFGTQYTEFDLDLAREHLAASGYDNDADGRLLDDEGRPVVITVLAQARFPDIVDGLQLIKATWEQIGVELRIDTISAELVAERLAANDFDCTIDKGELGYLDLVGDPRWIFAKGQSSFAPLWTNWYEGSSPSEEPPAAMQEQIRIYREQVIGSTDRDTQYAGLAEMITIAQEEFWTMGVSLPGEPFAIVADRLHNVPGDGEMWIAFKAPFPATSNMTAFYLDQE